ncbi:MAG: hypothetical protein A2V66_07120 [Ignavibacteria bacterium RBG_13_36_8]|nr:MAG: hypothetical protein A2V66_07120 [Ignavibacteria bacterium RBG_13_36_8]
MFSNYFKITIRNLIKHKAYSFINIFGLAVGIACCLLILLWVEDELSYDKFNEKSDRLYRVARITGESQNERTPAILGPTLKDEYPEISNVSRYRGGRTFIKLRDKFFDNLEMAYVDPSFFDLFTVNFIQGNAANALADNSSILLTESCANKLFGNSNPVGKIVKVGVKQDYIVTGIIEDFPSDSHMRFDCLVNFDSRDKSFESMFGENNWKLNGYSTYVLLKEGTDSGRFNDKIKDIIKRHRENSESEIFLQPVTEINLHPLEEEGNLKYLYIFSIIALFILTIACINFMNLSTARSSTRAKEVGMRKVIGAARSSLIKQFLGESFILTTFSVLIACLIVVLSLTYFNDLSGKEIELSSIANPGMLLIVIAITIFTALLAGGYPALYLSSLIPSSIFKKSARSGRFAGLFRKYMVIFQFSISTLLIVGVSVVYKQLSYMVDTDMGYYKGHMIFFSAPQDYLNNFESIKSELLANPNVINTAIGSPPMLLDFSVDNITWEGKNENEEIAFAKYHVDYNYVKTLGLQILEGRDFSKSISTDAEDAYIINETAAKVIGKPVLNKKLTFDTDIIGGSGRVIGVIKDFHHSSFHEKIIPLVLDINNEWVFSVIARINSHNIPSTIQFLEDKWKERITDRPFEYAFFDEEIDNFYKKENQMAKLLGTFSVLAVVIACLGLFGLVTFITELRTKEIGIRKVLGSNVPWIVFILAKEFIKWVVIANVLAWPVAYFMMGKWLEGFAYRVDISIWIFIIAALVALSIALITIGSQTIKAASANPVDSLKYE